MRNLNIVNLYEEEQPQNVDAFSNGIKSSLMIKTDYDKIVCDYEWMDIMEDTIMYLDNILRNPNRFIINEEEIVKIELARKITVDSIKHLSKNTNLIQDIDKKTGDVKPSKILNINKEENFNTYENRFIYTLIENMRSYIELKKPTIKTSSSLKDYKAFNYTGQSSIGNEKININLNLESSVNEKDDNGTKNGQSANERLEKLEMRVNDLTNSEVYKTLKKAHVALVTSPIKKTNVILKNTNFQYAVKLWNYLQENVTKETTKREKDKSEYSDTGKMKNYVDETFLLDYLTLNLLSKSGEKKNIKLSEKKIEEITNGLIQKIVEINSDMSEEKLQEMAGTKIYITKQKHNANIKEIEQIYNKYIDEYLHKMTSFKF